MPKKPEMIEGSYLKPKTIFLEKDYWQIEDGCKLFGIPVSKFREKDIPELVRSGKMTPYTPVKGTVRTVRSYFHHVGIKQPKNVDIPEELRSMKFTGRKFYDGMTLGKIRRMPKKEREKLFIKARDIQKAWSGSNADDECLQQTGLFPDNTPLFCCDYKKNLYESNCNTYVREGKIITSSTNAGELKLVEEVIKTWKTNVHSAYRLDLGYFNSHSTTKYVIVELNEVWSNGHNVSLKQDRELRWNDLDYHSYEKAHIEKTNKEAVLLLLARWKDFKLVRKH